MLADTDPLGVNVNVTFEQVGGLDDHIASLKEMVTLPLLYPEIFQEFKITPPRGVLFHGPPGTGKTLLARALAASARSGGREVGSCPERLLLLHYELTRLSCSIFHAEGCRHSFQMGRRSRTSTPTAIRGSEELSAQHNIFR